MCTAPAASQLSSIYDGVTADVNSRFQGVMLAMTTLMLEAVDDAQIVAMAEKVKAAAEAPDGILERAKASDDPVLLGAAKALESLVEKVEAHAAAPGSARAAELRAEVIKLAAADYDGA